MDRMQGPRHCLPGMARYLSEDSGQESLPPSSADSESDYAVDPGEAGPSKLNPRALFFCELCEAECSSIEALQDHFAGTRHQKKLCLNGLSSSLKHKYNINYEDELSGKVVECTLCKVIFHGLEGAFHFKSEKHQALCNFATESKIDNRQWLRVVCDAPDKSADDELLRDMDEPEKVADGYYCDLCAATMPTETLFQAHIEGKRHQKKARWQYLCLEGDTSEVNQYWCRLCNMFCTDRDALTTHYRGRNHIKTLQKKNIIKLDKQVDGSSDKPEIKCRSKGQELIKIKKEPADDEVDSKFRSSGHSKRLYRKRSPSTSGTSFSSSPSRSPSPSPPRRRNRSPWSYNRRFSHRSPSSESYHSSERGRKSSSKQSSHRWRSGTRSRSHSPKRRSSHEGNSKSRVQRDSHSHRRHSSSSSHNRRSRYHDDDSDSTVSRGRSRIRSHDRHRNVHSSSDYSIYRSYSRSRSRSRDRYGHSWNRNLNNHSRYRGRSRGRGKGGRRKSYDRVTRWRDGEHRREPRPRHPLVKSEPQSEEDDNDPLDRFKGFSKDWRSGGSVSDDPNAPPLASLTVSYILHSIRESCKK